MPTDDDPLELDPVLPSELFRTTRLPKAKIARPHRARPAPPREAGLLKPGSILDKYRIEELLGVGGFAAVYRATHLLLQVPVAIKLLRPRILARDPRLADELLREARFAARIDHPNIVRIHDVTHSPAITFIVMELIDGGSLARRLATRGPLSAAKVFKLALDVAEGLRAGLAQGLVHRDIKPGNILLTRGRSAKVVDFGLAYAESFGADSSSPAVASEPVVGTRGYMAPEQIRAPSRVDFRADVYSLGVTLLEALTGSVHGRASGGRPGWTSIRQLLDLAPPLAVPILRAMTADDPDSRPSSYAGLIEELRACAEKSGTAER